MNLAHSCLLVDLDVSTWGARKTERRISHVAAERFSAEESRISGVLRLLPPGTLTPWTSAVGALRRAHERLTVPYDSGVRVLAGKVHAAYLAAVNPQLENCASVADRVTDSIYDAIQREAAKQGSLFNARNYPVNIRSKFGARIRTFPFPDSNAFNVLGLQLTDERAQVDAMSQEVSKYALQEVADRVAEVCERIVDRMRTYDGTATGRFSDSLIGNVHKLLESIPALNIADDSRIAEVERSLAALATVDPQDLRDSESLRQSTEQEAGKILASVNAWL